MYVILVAVTYVFLSMSVMQRKKQIGIFKALGGNTRDILRIFIWEGVVIAIFAWVLATYLGYAYVLDINIKFFNTLPVLVFNWMQAGLNLILIFTVSISFIILTVMGILKNNSVISILKK
jgi:ABC-type lipoprotein release transport system permease subunit